VDTLLSKDKAFVWHPFTHLKYAEAPINIVRSEGVYFFDDKGNKIIDAISSWWVNLHGHCHPYISKKVAEQLNVNEHSIFSGFTHPNAILLAERLLQHLPSNLGKVFYSDNGSTAVEVALKMALQYWNNKGESKTTFIAFENAYHGDTFGGMSVGERNVFNQAFTPLLFDVERIPLPTDENIDGIIEEISKISKTKKVAGFIFEPLVQGAAGMFMYKAVLLDKLIEHCKANKILCIADEVMTGFGRTGTFFASEQLQHKADIVCLSKGLTGGYMPLGVTACTNEIHHAFIEDDKTKTFFHGHSYTANPTACSAALASMDLMEMPLTFENINRIHNKHVSFLHDISSSEACKNVRVVGTILAIELRTIDKTHYLNTASEFIASYFIDKGILLRPLGNVLYILPPYCITNEELNYIYNTIKQFLDAYLKR
jgi:adenosylmethionine---8-amino-7-oxononanoate aminotransferase